MLLVLTITLMNLRRAEHFYNTPRITHLYKMIIKSTLLYKGLDLNMPIISVFITNLTRR